MKNLYYLALIAIAFNSCDRSYKYVEVIEEENGKKAEKEPIEIEGKNDSLAYVKALERFLVSQGVATEFRDNYGENYTPKPVSFNLYDPEGNIVEPPPKKRIDSLRKEHLELEKDMKELSEYLTKNPID